MAGYGQALGNTSSYAAGRLDFEEMQELITRARAVVERVTGANSVYSTDVRRSQTREKHYEQQRLEMVIGIVRSLRADLASDSLDSLPELVRAELFSDFLEMAEHLLAEGYKDPAAVVCGSALEAHLRALCVKAGVATLITTPRGDQPKKADTLNSDLVKANVFGKLDQKNVTAWLDLRNKAAHGHYSEYTVEQVKLMVAAVSDFIARNPAYLAVAPEPAHSCVHRTASAVAPAR